MSDTGDEPAVDQGVTVSNVICANGHGNSGQVMENKRLGGYECPECGRVAEFSLEWSDPDE